MNFSKINIVVPRNRHVPQISHFWVSLLKVDKLQNPGAKCFAIANNSLYRERAFFCLSNPQRSYDSETRKLEKVLFFTPAAKFLAKNRLFYENTYAIFISVWEFYNNKSSIFCVFFCSEYKKKQIFFGLESWLLKWLL